MATTAFKNPVHDHLCNRAIFHSHHCNLKHILEDLIMLRVSPRLAVVIILSVSAIGSLAQGFSNALEESGSRDFQYSAARLLLSGVNPYEWWESNRNDFLLAQAPNYLPLLFGILAPFGALDWPAARLLWAIVNVSLAAAIAILIYRGQIGEGREFAVGAALVFLSSTAVRNTIGNGQHGLIVTLAVLVSLGAFRPFYASVALAIAVTKYSIGAFYGAAMLSQRRMPILLLAGLVSVLAHAALWLITSTPPSLSAILAPIGVTSTGMALYFPFDLLKDSFGHGSILVVPLVGLALVATLAVIGQLDTTVTLGTVATFAALTFAPHAGYDFVLLAVPFALGLSLKDLPSHIKWIAIGLIGYHWSVGRLADVFLAGIASEILQACLWVATAVLCAFFFAAAASGHRLLGSLVDRPRSTV